MVTFGLQRGRLYERARTARNELVLLRPCAFVISADILRRIPQVETGMKLHQLRYLAAIAESGLNISAAAEKLHTSQPGVSRQIKLLEDELGFELFMREGRSLTRVTQAGQRVIERAQRILKEIRAIKALSLRMPAAP